MNCPTNNSDKNKAILELQKVRAAISASVVTNLSHLTDDDLKKLDKLVTKRRNENGNYTAEEFKKLPQRKKAVIMAYDVIANIKARKFVVKKGTYITAANHLEEEGLQTSVGTDEGKQCLVNAQCHVCAKGAMFVTSALKTNSLDVRSVVYADEENMSERLVDSEGVFDQKTFDTIEVAFEGVVEGTAAEDRWDGLFGGDPGAYFEDDEDGNSRLVMCKNARRVFKQCEKFYCAFNNSADRLVAIMLNVIKHNGKFVPSWIPPYREVGEAMK